MCFEAGIKLAHAGVWVCSAFSTTAQNIAATHPNFTSQSQKTVSLIDLCGHEKYLKTTIFGMTAMAPGMMHVHGMVFQNSAAVWCRNVMWLGV
jgi:hypothetical protein